MGTVRPSGIGIVRAPSGERWTTIGSYPTYAEAQRAVDRLSDASFAVENVQIVGRDLRLVERVTGRLTKGRAAEAGAASGAWLGLFIGLLIGLFAKGSAWLWLVVGAVVIGAFWGAVLGFAAHWATRGTRDFSSVGGIEADHYDVMAVEGRAAEAQTILGGAG